MDRALSSPENPYNKGIQVIDEWLASHLYDHAYMLRRESRSLGGFFELVDAVINSIGDPETVRTDRWPETPNPALTMICELARRFNVSRRTYLEAIHRYFVTCSLETLRGMRLFGACITDDDTAMMEALMIEMFAQISTLSDTILHYNPDTLSLTQKEQDNDYLKSGQSPDNKRIRHFRRRLQHDEEYRRNQRLIRERYDQALKIIKARFGLDDQAAYAEGFDSSGVRIPEEG
jgi:hypothetical protein